MSRRYDTSTYGSLNQPATPQEAAIRYTEEQAGRVSHQQRKSLVKESEHRLSQFLDEDDHKKCVDVNKQALLAEKLERLRALKDEIAKEDWMFTPKPNMNSFSGWKSGS